MLKKLIVVSAFAIPLGWNGSAAAQSPAQSPECTCVTPLSAEGVVGQVSGVTGQVLSSQAGGLGSAGEGTNLFLGSQLITGPESSANISVGSCVLAVAPSSEVAITRVGSNICVRVVEAAAVTTGQIPTTNGTASYGPLIIFGGVAAGAAVLSAIGGGDERASP